MRIKHFFKVHGSLLIIAVSSVVAGFAINIYTTGLEKQPVDDKKQTKYGLLIAFSTVFGIIGSIMNAKRTGSFEKNLQLLDATTKELDKTSSLNKKMYDKAFTTLYEILQTYLADIAANDLKDIVKDSERITIYAHYSQEKGFRQIGRYSEQPKYNRRSSIREFYPEDQGSISRAWLEGECEILLSDPVNNFEAYKNELITLYNFTEDVIANITMRSRLFIGYSIRDEHNNRIGVILFESTMVDRLKRKKSQLKTVAADNNKILQTIIKKEKEFRDMFL